MVYRRCVVAVKGNIPAILVTESAINPITVVAANNIYSNRFGMTVNNAVYTTSNSYYTAVSLAVFPTVELTTAGSITGFDSATFQPFWAYTYTDSANTPSVVKNLTGDPVYAAAVKLTLSPGIVGTGTISATSILGGTAPYTVSWTGLSSSSAGAKSNLDPGIYTISVTDSAATPATKTYTYTVLLGPPGPTITPGTVTNITVFGQSTGRIGLATLGTTTGPYTYLWSSTNAIQNKTTLEAKTGLSAGSYTFTVKDGLNHTSSYTYVITQAAVLTLAGGVVTPASKSGAADGSISAITISGGTAPFTYAWTSGSTVLLTTAGPLTGLKKGGYGFKATDSAGSVITSTYTMIEDQIMSLTGGAITNVAIYGQATGSISAITVAGGLGPYTYVWSNSVGATAMSAVTTAAAQTGLLAGVYTFTATDSRNVALTQTFTVTQNARLTTSGGVAQNPCGAANGSISQIVPVGGLAPYTALWSSSNGASTVSAPATLYAKLSLLPGTYTCVITDSVSAIKTLTFTLVETYVPMTYTAGTVTHATFYSASNGAVSAIVMAGGYQPYAYAWSSNGAAPSTVSGVQTPGLTNVKAGQYTLTVSDATARYITQSYSIGQPISLSETHIDITSSQPTGSISVIALGGLGSYSYAWTKDGTAISNTTATVSGLGVGSYVCTVTTSLYSTAIAVDVATFMTTTIASTTVRIQWNAITGAQGYKVYYSLPGTPMVNKTLYNASTQANFCIISGLTPATTYVMEVYSTTDNITYKRSYASTVTTLATDSTVFNKALVQNGLIYDITKLQDVDAQQQSALTAKIVNANFATADSALSYATVSNDTQKVTATIVQLNYSIQVGKNSTIYLPFDNSNPAAQTVTLILQDSSTVLITYTQASNTIYVAGASLTPGSTFQLDNQSVTVASAK